MRKGTVAAAESLTKRIGQRIADQNSFSFARLHRGSKRMWDQVRRITGKNTTTVCGGPDAAELNQHYANISTDPRYETPGVKATVSHANLEFSEYSVFNILDKLKPIATGLDGLPVWFIRGISLDCWSCQSYFQLVLQDVCGICPVEAQLHYHSSLNCSPCRMQRFQTYISDSSLIQGHGKVYC